MPPKKEKQVFYSIFINGKKYDVTGRKRNNKGYVLLCIHKHPFSDCNGMIFEHRVMIEMKLNRFLKKDEIVHHKNEIKHDNRISNLELMNRSEHTSFHNIKTTFSKERRRKISESKKRLFENESNHPSFKDVNDELLKMYKNGMRVKDITEKLSITRRTYYNKLKKLGVDYNDKQSDVSW